MDNPFGCVISIDNLLLVFGIWLVISDTILILKLFQVPTTYSISGFYVNVYCEA